jgi:hypothetical protein
LDFKANSSENERKFVRKSDVVSEVEGLQGYTYENFDFNSRYIAVKMKRNTILENGFKDALLNCPYLVVVYKLSFMQVELDKVTDFDKYPFTVFGCQELGIDKFDLNFGFSLFGDTGNELTIVNDKRSSRRVDDKAILSIYNI